MSPREFADYLKLHACGEDRAISARNLALSRALNDRECRDLAEAAAKEGLPICTSGQGYYWPKDKREVYVCTDRLDHQAKSMLARSGNLRKAGERIFGTNDLFPSARGAANA